MANKTMQVRRTNNQQYRAPSANIGRSQINLSRPLSTTFDASRLIPVFIEDVLPGDTMTCKMNSFIRIFSPLDAPMFSNLIANVDFFYVPDRILWENWKAFLGEHTDGAGAQDTTYQTPICGAGINFGNTDWDKLGAYFGLPLNIRTGDNDFLAAPFRAYRTIWNTFYRDQNSVDPVAVGTDDGPDGNAETGINAEPLKVSKVPDYFTTALPYLQKGTAQAVALSGTAPVTGIGADNQTWSSGSVTVHESDGSNPTYTSWKDMDSASGNQRFYVEEGLDSNPNIFADITGVTVDINALRESAAIQRFLERSARGGTRHPEIIKSTFGVDVPDYRTQHPEYLGGSKTYINISPVANTSDTASADQGQLRGVGTGSLSASFAKSFVEHGWVIGLAYVRSELSYFQGIDKKWSRRTIYDYYWPDFAGLGEQPIYNRELYVNNTSTDGEVFGYTERHGEYRWAKGLITGKFNPDASGSLSYWHTAEDFPSTPSLNQTFLEDATPMDRVTTVTTEPDFIMDAYFDCKAARAMPVKPVPSLLPMRF